MGTSQDYLVAVEEGATIVRIGTRLYDCSALLDGRDELTSISRETGRRAKTHLHRWLSATPGTAHSSTSASPRSITTTTTRIRRGSEVELEDRYRERPNVRRLRRRRDEFDDIFADDDSRPAAAGSPRRAGARHRAEAGGWRGNGDVRVHLVVPKSFNDAQQIADKFKDSIPVILNLQSSDTDLSKRLIDFASGLTYALDGGMQRIADKVFMLTPRNVEISAEERARLIEKGFFNQQTAALHQGWFLPGPSFRR
jgi:cell division inhibitor SepF